MTGVVVCSLLAAAAVLAWPRAGRPSPQWSAGSVEVAPGVSWRARLPGAGSRRARHSRDEALGELLALVAGPLRSGAPAAVALDAARSALGPGSLDGLVADLVATGQRAEPLAPVWSRWANRLTSDELAFVASAWALTEDTGAPLADALETSLDVVRARRRAADRVASAAAGPRASMLVLLLLPLSGPLVGLACGIGPRTLYLSSPAATGSLLAGLVLAVLARWWSARILAKAA
ncbi:type II secretion system F family protein [Pedococcus sp. NPDC057267]|uniref:type II secretion system F family protein n=1 Tax=Pedococcus sp. NPDC057267 TaxID=3346077 RepID=UPI00363FB8BA